MTHNHTAWAIAGASCTVCSSIFEQVKELAAKVVFLEKRLKTVGSVCSVCFTSSFAPCEATHKSSVRNPAGHGYMYCQFCWLIGEHS